MILIERDTSSGIATVAFSNGRVNAIRMDLVETLAAALFAGSLEILRHLAGGRIADRVAGSGVFFDPDDARALGLVNELCDGDDLLDCANALVEGPSIERFMDIWYAPAAQESLERIVIRE